MFGQLIEKARGSPFLVVFQIGFVCAIIFPFCVVFPVFHLRTSGTTEQTIYQTKDYYKYGSRLWIEVLAVDFNSYGGASQPSLNLVVFPHIPHNWRKATVGTNITYSIMLEALTWTKNDIVPCTANLRLRNGTVARYPFDTYTIDAHMGIFYDSISSRRWPPLAVKITLGAQYGWDVAAEIAPRARNSGRAFQTIRFSVKRSALFQLYPIFMIVALWCITIMMLYYASCVFIWEVKSLETPLIGTLFTCLFSVASFRNTAPGSPPIGCTLDFCAFFWTMLTIVIVLISLFFRYVNMSITMSLGGMPLFNNPLSNRSNHHPLERQASYQMMKALNK